MHRLYQSHRGDGLQRARDAIDVYDHHCDDLLSGLLNIPLLLLLLHDILPRTFDE